MKLISTTQSSAIQSHTFSKGHSKSKIQNFDYINYYAFNHFNSTYNSCYLIDLSTSIKVFFSIFIFFYYQSISICCILVTFYFEIDQWNKIVFDHSVIFCQLQLVSYNLFFGINFMMCLRSISPRLTSRWGQKNFRFLISAVYL